MSNPTPKLARISLFVFLSHHSAIALSRPLEVKPPSFFVFERGVKRFPGGLAHNIGFCPSRESAYRRTIHLECREKANRKRLGLKEVPVLLEVLF